MLLIARDGVEFQVVDRPLYDWFWPAFSAGRWEPATFRVLDRFLTPEWRFVDIGAWIGPLTLYAAKKCQHVDAFECDPEANRDFRDNLALNPDIASKVELNDYALGDRDGSVCLFSTALGNSETSIFAEHERYGRIVSCDKSVLAQVRDAGKVFRDRGYAECERTLVKIDVEGAEFQIIPRIAELIPQSRCVWYVSFHELNVNPPGIPARDARQGEMLRALSAFGQLRWYGGALEELDQEQVLSSVRAGTWPVHESLLFTPGTGRGPAGRPDPVAALQACG